MKKKGKMSSEKEAESMTVDEVKDLLDRTGKGMVKDTPSNYNTIFLNDPLLKGAFRGNMLTGKTDIVKDLGWHRESEQLSDVDTQYLILYLDKNYGLSSEKKITGAVLVAANEYRYHPIIDYLNGLKWDGKERIRYALHHFLGAEISDENEEMLRLFMLGAVSRIFDPGIKFEYMLCLVGDQGIGKSTFLRFLAIKDDWFSDDLRKLEDDNIYRKLQGHWIIEMSEMIATSSARTIEDIKSFLSRQKDTYKVPYATYPLDYKRQCVFAGTSNALDFLPLDRTGNRRFLPVKVNGSCSEVHILEDEEESRAYVDQMWAEIMEQYKSGNVSLKLSGETEHYLKEHQTEFMPEDTLAVKILNFLDAYGGDIVCSLQIYHDALDHPFGDDPKRFDIKDINAVMNNYAEDWVRFENPRCFPAPYGRQKGWERITDSGNQKGDEGCSYSADDTDDIGFLSDEWPPI